MSAWLIKPKPSMRRDTFPGVLKPDQLAGSSARGISMLRSFLAILLLTSRAMADPAVPAAPTGTPVAPPQNEYGTVSQLGDPEQQAAQREGRLLSHRRTSDPFGNVIRGPFKALPSVVEHVTSTPAASAAASPAAAVYVPTLDKAVQDLVIGAVNLGNHEILVGSRSIREGDLLILESEDRQFAVWVENVGVRGVLFLDINLQKQILKPFGAGPKGLPENSVWGLSDIHHLLNENAPQ
jgi:hypothetical protein